MNEERSFLVEHTFDALFAAHPWKAIRGCPGRFVLRGGPSTINELVGVAAQPQRFSSSTCRDPVDVVAFASGGGLICYATANGHVHTLCDKAGFARKLAALGIVLPGADTAREGRRPLVEEQSFTGSRYGKGNRGGSGG